jgi:hypothetical protein
LNIIVKKAKNFRALAMSGVGGVGIDQNVVDMDEHVVQEGWLLKRGEHIRNWRNR